MHIDPLSVIYMSAKTYVLYRSFDVVTKKYKTNQRHQIYKTNVRDTYPHCYTLARIMSNSVK